MTGNRSQLMNFASKFLGTVRFENNQIAKIMGVKHRGTSELVEDDEEEDDEEGDDKEDDEIEESLDSDRCELLVILRHQYDLSVMD
ncbi:hypothetical protein Tco_0908837 [Tanacetum coccineum]|uniref:Uncharacterized protein n=1 Tax=Tanacetum coccineum TaxID=301880 RepID=A0ABQ5CR24_9ASTR